ncbi:MAG: AMP-binding protein, partial [Ktedonobacterales bacterium]
MNVYEYLLANVRSTDTAIISRRESVTYGELLDMAERIGSSLRASSIMRGDRVGIVADNSAYWVASYLGILRIGAVGT